MSLSGEAKDVLNVIVVGMFHAIEIHVIRALLNVFRTFWSVQKLTFGSM